MPAALVDVDGTLVDSNYHHTIAWSRALRDHGHNARLAAIHRLVGMGGSDLLKELTGEADEAIEESWRKHFDELLPEVWAFEGAADLLRGLHDRGVTVVLATSSPEDLLGDLRERFGAADAIDAVVSSGDVDGAKPRPDIFEAACNKAGVEPGDAFVIGDSVWDVEAAKRADIRCIALETGGFSRAELEHAGAAAVYEDCKDLLAHLDEVLG
jgi:HAD superfamily hydrolase (TIGR01509 family)